MNNNVTAIKGDDLVDVENCLDAAAGVLPLRCEHCGGPAESEEKIRRWQYAVGKNYAAVQRARIALGERLKSLVRANPIFEQCQGEEQRIRAEAAANKDGKVPCRTLEDGTREIIVPQEKQEAVAAAIQELWSKPENAKARKARAKDERAIERELDKIVLVPMHRVAWADTPRGMKGTYLSYLSAYMLDGVPEDLQQAATANRDEETRLVAEAPAEPGFWARIFGRGKKTRRACLFG
jgi:hypothetical protein